MRVTVKEPATLIAFLQSKMPEASTTKLRSLLKYKSVLVDGVPQPVANTPVARGQVIEILSTTQRAVNNARVVAPFKVLFEDEFILAVDKPRGWLSIAREDETRETLYQHVYDYVQAASNGKQRCFIVHRLDREVSGVMLFAKTEEAKRRLMLNWDQNQKIYAAVVEGLPEPRRATIESHLDESQPARVRVVAQAKDTRGAITHYEVIKYSPKHALLEVNIETGRRHQIRAHLSSIGCPIAGDKRYGAKTNPLRRVGLHAWRLSFEHPITKQRMNIESPPPASFFKLNPTAPPPPRHRH
nr:ribosomal large subunit pseudouridine synthase D [uncultured bacterium]